jgi:chromosome segregation ATPase
VDNQTRVSTLESELVDNQARISTLESELADNQTRISTLESELVDNQTRVSTLDSELVDNQTRVSTLESELVDNQTRVSTLESEVRGSKALVVELQAELGEGRDRARVLSTDADAAKNELRQRTAEVEAMGQRATEQATMLASRAAELGELRARVARQESQLAELSELRALASRQESRLAEQAAALAGQASELGHLGANADTRAGAFLAQIEELSSRLEDASAAHEAEAERCQRALERNRSLEAMVVRLETTVGELRARDGPRGSRIEAAEDELERARAEARELSAALRDELGRAEGLETSAANRDAELETLAAELARIKADRDRLRGRVNREIDFRRDLVRRRLPDVAPDVDWEAELGGDDSLMDPHYAHPDNGGGGKENGMMLGRGKEPPPTPLRLYDFRG